MQQFTAAFLFGMLVASGWWGLAMFGWPDFIEHNEPWRVTVAFLTGLGTVVAGFMVFVGAITDAIDRCPSDESTEEEEDEPEPEQGAKP